MYGDNGTSILTLNQTDNATSEKWELSFSATMATILSISSFLTLVGNTMVVTVVIRHPGMRTRTNLFLMNLALADFLVGLLPVPFAISTLVMGTWIFGDVLCTIVGFLNAFCLVASIHTLMYISIHKCYSITRPFSDPFKLSRILIMMAAAWFWAGVSATITVTGLTYVRYKPGTSQCGPQYPHDIKSYLHHYIIQATNIIIPLIIMIYCYGRMFYEIRKHAVRLQKNSTIEGDVLLAQQKRAFWTLFTVLACFIVCWLPYHGYASYLVLTKSFKSTNFLRHFNPVAYMFGYINSACNPIIYALRSPSFRQGYKEILCRSSGYLISDDPPKQLELGNATKPKSSRFWLS
ncbi:octopamine receptor 1 isoform X2 [Patella vulgata]|uniref:octopamine receptor 1 isoform X2 n=1 Tax=Patella vulgata TaxID=6465 RepID=UPI0024A9B53C|nr:octopamine receptor 1 isoform X2 [Patella vulgata]